MTYECHITVDSAHSGVATRVATALGWKTSEIWRDPVLGEKNFFYLTTHSTSFPAIMKLMEECAQTLTDINIPILRKKIELVIYDSKFLKA